MLINTLTNNILDIKQGVKTHNFKVCNFGKLPNILSTLQGYFQLKANPGAWTLRLRKGRSEDIYRIYR